MSIKYNEELKNKAIEYYLSGISAAKSAELIGVNEATVRAWLKLKGIKMRNSAEYSRKYDEIIIKNVIELYNKGLNTTEIQNKLELKRGIPSYILRNAGVELRHRGPKSMIELENFFDVIDSEHKAYFLGWLMADGNISITNNQYSLKIHIALKDKELIDKFISEIKSHNKTKVKEGQNSSYYVSLSSVHLCKSLMKLGVVPRKSGKEIFPVQIPKELYCHFVRGLFDGDGITDIKRKRSGFVGSYNIITCILNFIKAENLKVYQNKKNVDIFYFLGGKKFSRKLYEYMYKDSTIWLERKRHRMEEICF